MIILENCELPHEDTKSYDLDNLPSGPTTSVENIAKTLGTKLSHSNLYGPIFNVYSKFEPNNVAYTDVGLELHQDLVYYDSGPGLQILECVKSGEGGESTFSDLIGTAEEMEEDDLKLLESTKLTFRKQREGVDLVFQRSVVERTGENVTSVNWSPQFEGIPYLNQSVDWEEYYEAYDRFASKLKENQIEFKLREGESVVFNNRRLAHGRKPFEGERWMQGGYVGVDDWVDGWRGGGGRGGIVGGQSENIPYIS